MDKPKAELVRSNAEAVPLVLELEEHKRDGRLILTFSVPYWDKRIRVEVPA